MDDSGCALEYARRNGAGTSVRFVQADVTDAGLLAELEGSVDLVVANPPYVPADAALPPEVAEHDPHHALFAGSDGMAVIPAIVAGACRWLRPGGHLGVEHHETTSGDTVEVVTRTGCFTDIQARTDLAGRLRFVTATRTPT